MFFALVIKHAMHMHRFMLLSVVCEDLTYFSTLFHKRHEFRKKLLGIKFVCWFSLQLCLKCFSSRKNSARYYHKSTCVFM